MKHFTNFIFILLFTVLLPHCKDKSSNNPSQEQAVTIATVTTDSSIIIKNTSGSIIYSVIFEQKKLSIIDWAQNCTSSISIKPDSSRESNYQDILGYSDSCKVVVFWWTCSAAEPDSLYGLLIQTK